MVPVERERRRESFFLEREVDSDPDGSRRGLLVFRERNRDGEKAEVDGHGAEVDGHGAPLIQQRITRVQQRARS